jgi:glycine/D-amino acid oxidase-like deaminating enzyme
VIKLDTSLDETLSWWMKDVGGDELDDAGALEHDVTADVAIVGGGYTGLWTAMALSERPEAPHTVVLEAGASGSQASGKNGGVVHGYWTSVHRLAVALGNDGAATVAQAGSAAQEAVAAFCAARPETWWSPQGVMKVSTTPLQDAALGVVADAARALGRPDQARTLSRDEVQDRCASPRFRAGVYFPEAATVHPARLVRALRDEVRRRGIAVHERSKALEIRREGDSYRVITPAATVRARSVVLAANSALAGISAVRPHLTNFSSFAVMTEPAPEVLAEIGWTGGEALLDSRMFLHYFRTTPDGRVLMGTGSGAIGFGRRNGAALTRDEKSVARAVAGLRWLLPAFADVPIARGWGGPIDVSSDHLPFFGTVPGERLFYGCGYSGHGVNAGWIGGQTLASLALGQADEWTRSPLCRRKPPWLPPEPMRYVGGRLIRAAILRCEEADQAGRQGPAVARATARLPKLLRMPIGMR